METKKQFFLGYLTLLLLAFSSCSHFPKSEKSKITSENKYVLTFTDNDGKVFAASLGVKTKYADAWKDLDSFRKDFYTPMNQRFFTRIEELERQVTELKAHSTSLTRRLAAALAIALLVPVPGAFETTLTIGLVYVTYKKLTESDAEKQRKIHVESLIEECLNTARRLKNYQTYTFLPFPYVWEKEFRENENHYVNAEDETDIRLLDSVMERYLAEKEILKTSSLLELKNSNSHCSNREVVPETKPTAKKKK